MQMTDARTSSFLVDKFSLKVDSESVWCPDSEDYETWICLLLCCLIDSGAVHDEMFQLLLPVCRIKVTLLEK